MKGGQIIGVYEDVTEDDIADYADGHEMLKILVAYSGYHVYRVFPAGGRVP